MAKEFEKQIGDIVFSSNNGFNFNQIIDKINYQKNCWRLCRFDLKNSGNEFNRINILDNDNSLHIDFPSWFRDYQGQGCQIEGGVNKLNLKFQCVNDGKLRFYLKGVDYRNSQQVRLPIYINFTTFKLNDELIFSEDKFVWHNQPYTFEISSKDKDIFNIYLEFKTIYDYYPSFLNLFNDVNSIEELNRPENKSKIDTPNNIYYERKAIWRKLKDALTPEEYEFMHGKITDDEIREVNFNHLLNFFSARVSDKLDLVFSVII